ncbi:MAG: efflux RND transporter periplasmic adaptor subunit [Bacteroidales bacterium]|nr:efflux RND transporter periplasmic adaptor subunit [Bacteroidales bacterium]
MKNLIQKIKENIKYILPSILIGLLFGWLFFAGGSNSGDTHNHDTEQTKETRWTCSMHPQIDEPEPGQCPICGMDLVPKNTVVSDDEAVSEDEILMSQSAIKLADIQTYTVEKGMPEKKVYLLGKAQPDERKIAELTARFSGRIEKLFVNFTGQNVKRGQRLATIYSPELVAAQKELMEAISFKVSNPSFYTAARSKLKLWDLSDRQIDDIEKNGKPKLYFDILSPISGTVTMRHVALGDYVKEGNALFQVVDLTKIWVLFDAYESDLPWLKKGDKINFVFQSIPGENFNAEITFIDPFINPQTRVAKVRVELKNPNLKIKPEMFVDGIVQSEISEEMNDILIPKSSVLWTGKRSVVYVKVPNRKNPSFKMKTVVLGPEAGNFYIINSGLKEGEVIASNGVFKIDAAAQLAGVPSMMNPEKETAEINLYRLDTPKEFVSQLNTLLNSYLKMKDGFFNAKKEETQKQANEILKNIEKVNMELVKGDAHMFWMKKAKIIKNKARVIAEAENIDTQRRAFKPLSETMIDVYKSFGLENETVYVQFCPMFDENKGASWLSAQKQIQNPYYGDLMPTCGEIKDSIQ